MKTNRVVWVLYALVLVLAPVIFTSSLSMTLLSQMGIAIIACLSYNLLFGQGGMMSFGHAVYTGLGAYLAIHALNATATGWVAIPVPLIPLVGGLAGLIAAVLFGYVATRTAGAAFAMITLGLGEMVMALAMMRPDIFGGEGGVSANRVVGTPFLGVTLGPAIEVYYLIAAYTLVCSVALYAFTQTPLGRLLNAVRDNSERVEFIGFNPARIRYISFIIAGFFAGIAGGLAALNFELVSPEVLGTSRSGAYLVFTFLGGASYFWGPVVGAILMVLAFVWLSEVTQAWLLYVGLIFMFTVILAPGGLIGWFAALHHQVRQGQMSARLPRYIGLLMSAAMALLGAAALVEMMYHWQQHAALGNKLRFLGVDLIVNEITTWLGAGSFLVGGVVLFMWVQRRELSA